MSGDDGRVPKVFVLVLATGAGAAGMTVLIGVRALAGALGVAIFAGAGGGVAGLGSSSTIPCTFCGEDGGGEVLNEPKAGRFFHSVSNRF